MDTKQLRRELRTQYNTPQRAGEWTQDWDDYQEIDASKTGAFNLAALEALELRAKFHNVGPACICRFIRETMGWHEGAGPVRRGARSTNKPRSWVRFVSFSSDGPPREAIGRRLERLHWLAGMDPPVWDQVRTKEDCVLAVESFRALRCVHTMANGANFNPADWGTRTPWPVCLSCSELGRHCYTDE